MRKPLALALAASLVLGCMSLRRRDNSSRLGPGDCIALEVGSHGSAYLDSLWRHAFPETVQIGPFGSLRIIDKRAMFSDAEGSWERPRGADSLMLHFGHFPVW